MEMPNTITPIRLSLEQLERVKNSGECAGYWKNAFYLAQVIYKTIVLFMLASLEDDAEHSKYAHEYKIVRADGLGDWCDVLKSLVEGVDHINLRQEVQFLESREITERVGSDGWQYKAVDLLIQSAAQEQYELKLKRSKVKGNKNLLEWFELFSQFRNKIDSHSASIANNPSDDEYSAQLLEQSCFLILENFSAFKRSWVYLHQNLSGKYLVVNLQTPDRADIPRCFDLLKTNKPQCSIDDGVYVELNNVPYRINLLETDATAKVFYFPNGSFRNDKYESISYTSRGRRDNDGVEYTYPPQIQNFSETSGKEGLEELGYSLTNMPMEQPGYINRPSLEKELEEELTNDISKLIVLKGIGGIGKTALALHVAHQMCHREGAFDFVIWFSARDVDLSVDGGKRVSPDVLSANDIAKYYCKITGTPQSEDPSQAFQSALKDASRTLFIFDNFETISDIQAVYNMIRSGIRLPNKVVLTTRDDRSFKNIYDINVTGMEIDECKSLINRYAESLKIEDLINESIVNSLMADTDRHPYIIKLLLWQLKKNRRLEKVKISLSNQEQVLDFLCTRTYDNLSIPEIWVFLTLCQLNRPIFDFMIEAFFDNEECTQDINVADAIQELTRCSFIECTEVMSAKGACYLISVPPVMQVYGLTKIKTFEFEEDIGVLCARLKDFGVIQKADEREIEKAVKSKISALIRKTSNTEESALLEEMKIIENIVFRFPQLLRNVVDFYREIERKDLAISCLCQFIEKTDNEKEHLRLWMEIFSLSDLYDEAKMRLSLLKISKHPDARKDILSRYADWLHDYLDRNPEKKKDFMKVLEVLTERLRQIEKSGQEHFMSVDYIRLCNLMLDNPDYVTSDVRLYAEKGSENATNPAVFQSILEKLTLESEMDISVVSEVLNKSDDKDALSENINRLNYLLRNSKDKMSFDWRTPLRNGLNVICSHEEELNAEDCSRIAWGYLNLNDEDGAKHIVCVGLEIDPSNRSLCKLANNLSIPHEENNSITLPISSPAVISDVDKEILQRIEKTRVKEDFNRKMRSGEFVCVFIGNLPMVFPEELHDLIQKYNPVQQISISYNAYKYPQVRAVFNKDDADKIINDLDGYMLDCGNRLKVDRNRT